MDSTDNPLAPILAWESVSYGFIETSVGFVRQKDATFPLIKDDIKRPYSFDDSWKIVVPDGRVNSVVKDQIQTIDIKYFRPIKTNNLFLFKKLV
jgi:non-homologous end joining protein Ku